MLQNSPLYAYIPARDVKRARQFYESKLGLKPKEETGGGVAFWQVDDIEREVAQLKKRGVRFEEYDMPGMKPKNSIYTGGGAKAAWFKDSEEK
jgi:hypothetical protein